MRRAFELAEGIDDILEGLGHLPGVNIDWDPGRESASRYERQLYDLQAALQSVDAETAAATRKQVEALFSGQLILNEQQYRIFVNRLKRIRDLGIAPDFVEGEEDRRALARYSAIYGEIGLIIKDLQANASGVVETITPTEEQVRTVQTTAEKLAEIAALRRDPDALAALGKELALQQALTEATEETNKAAKIARAVQTGTATLVDVDPIATQSASAQITELLTFASSADKAFRDLRAANTLAAEESRLAWESRGRHFGQLDRVYPDMGRPVATGSGLGRGLPSQLGGRQYPRRGVRFNHREATVRRPRWERLPLPGGGARSRVVRPVVRWSCRAQRPTARRFERDHQHQREYRDDPSGV